MNASSLAARSYGLQTLFQKQLDSHTTAWYYIVAQMENTRKKSSGSWDISPFMGFCLCCQGPLLSEGLAMICPERLAVKEIGQTLEIDDSGRIWKIAMKNEGRIIPQRIKMRAEDRIESGYLGVRFRIDGKIIYIRAHRLVYQHFFGDIPDSFMVHHKNKNRKDNRPENLQAINSKDYSAAHKKRYTWKETLKAYKEHCKELDYKLQSEEEEK